MCHSDMLLVWNWTKMASRKDLAFRKDRGMRFTGKTSKPRVYEMTSYLQLWATHPIRAAGRRDTYHVRRGARRIGLDYTSQ